MPQDKKQKPDQVNVPRWARSCETIKWVVKHLPESEFARTLATTPRAQRSAMKKSARAICASHAFKVKLPYGLTREALNRRGQL